ncbi:MAG: glycoside hydrolase family 57 protein [Bacteroidota bacterium]
MRALCFYFQVHQPFRLKKYRFFDIGSDHHYYDDFQNKYIMNRVANKCYLPTNEVLLNLIKEYGRHFKVSFSISGVALEQFELYKPEVIDSFRALADTGCVEFIAETYSHSLSALKSKTEFFNQVEAQTKKIERLFGVKPVTFRNTELIYSDGIGEMVAEMGYQTQLTEGAKQVLGWKSPNFLYCNAINPKLKLLLKNFQLSDDIAFRFSQQSWGEWPLTTEKWVSWLNNIDSREEVVNLFMDYETFGEHQWPETGIFEFMKALPSRVLGYSDFKFKTPSEVSQLLQPVAAINVPHPISWADEERDLTAWLGNELQDEAFNHLYSLEEKIRKCSDERLIRDWRLLQTSDHFYYMCTKFFSDGDVHKYFNHYDTPYDAFMNYMNVLSDFIIQLDNSSNFNPLPYKTDNIDSIIEKAIKLIEKDIIETSVKIDSNEICEEEKSVKRLKKLELKNIKDFSNYKIKKIIKEIDLNILSHSLKGMPQIVKDCFLDNLGKNAKKEVEEKIASMVKVGKDVIEEYRIVLLEVMEKHR